MQSRVSLAELDVPLRPEDAVAIVRDVCRQYATGSLQGIPNPTVIRLTPDGDVVVEGPVSRDQDAVPAAAALLSELLPPLDRPAGFKVPGGLRLVLARATGALDLPPFADIEAFRAALERFAAPDLSATVRALFRACADQRIVYDARAPRELTVSDMRRARRATGLSLEDVSRVSNIPATKLRELEWGYFRNWSADAESRAALGRYAHAAGLAEDLVVSIAWPQIEREAREGWALVPAAPQALVLVEKPVVRPRPLLRYRWATALAAAVLLAISAIGVAWDAPAAIPAVTVPAIPAPAVPRAAPPTVAAIASPVAAGGVRRASYRRTSPPRPRPRKPARPAPKRS